jgi:thymidylate synthase (FAD)
MTTINAKLVALTQPTIEVGVSGPEALVAYIARLSNPENRTNPEYENLFAYCAKNKHWSIFQMVNAVVEVEAPRDITRQFTRHGSLFTIEGDVVREEKGFDTSQGGIQEFSQRYSDQIEFTDREYRRQDSKNRQNSTDDLDEDTQDCCNTEAYDYRRSAEIMYHWMRKQNVAKECARVILPEGLTMSRLYVNGTLRSWIHYLDVRDDEGVTQWEHVVLARKIKEVLLPAFPTVFGLLNGDT